MLRTNEEVRSELKAAMPIRNPAATIAQAIVPDTRSVGLFWGDHSAREGKPQRDTRSSNRILESNRRTTIPTIQANRSEIRSARKRATNPGTRLASLVMNLVVD